MIPYMCSMLLSSLLNWVALSNRRVLFGGSGHDSSLREVVRASRERKWHIVSTGRLVSLSAPGGGFRS